MIRTNTWSGKILALLLTAAMTLTLLPLAAVPAYAAAGDFTAVTVGETDALTTTSGSGWSWDINTNTLTVTGDITGDIRFAGTGNVTIAASGTHTISGRIICNAGLLTINGGGTLTVTSADTSPAVAIRAYNGLTIDNITVNATATHMYGCCVYLDSGDFTMSSGTLNANGVQTGIQTPGNINISGTANVTATISAGSYAILALGTITIDGTAVVTGNGGDGCGIGGESGITINGGTVTAKGEYANTGAITGNSAGSTNEITVTGGTLIVGDASANPVNGNIGGTTYNGNLTVSGSGANVTVNGDITGDLTVSDGTANITGAVSGTTAVTGGTVSVSGSTVIPNTLITTEADLISALQSGTASTITLGGNITLSTATVPMDESHTLNTNGKTLTISGGETSSTGGRIDLGSHTLTLKGNAVIESVQGIRSANGTLNLKNVTATLKIANSIYAGTVNVNSGATVNLNSDRSDGLGGSLLTLQNSTYSLNVNSGGVINIQDAFGVGINNSSSGKININNGGAINIGVIRNENWGVSLQGSGVLKLNSGGTLNGTAGGAIYLGVGTKVDGMSGKFIDQGTTLTATGEITVGAVDAPISATGLSRGLYIWNDSAFAKASSYTATLNIYEDNSPYSDSTGYILKLDGNETTTVNMTSGPGETRTAQVTNGTWKVYIGGDYTGVNIVINNAPGNARFDRYTGSYAVNPQGAATGGTFSAAITGIGGGSYNIGFGELPSSFYFKGDAVTFTATGEGASGYTYAWSGTHGGTQISGTDATYTIPSVSGTIDLTCTVTGSNGGSGTGTGSSGSGTSTPTTPPQTTTTAPGGNTVTTPAGKPPVQNPDGSATLPGGGTVTVGGQDGSASAGAPTVTITAPAGTVIDADGDVQIPANESATVTIAPQGAASGEGSVMTVTVPGGTSIDKDGNIAVPSGKEAEISLPESKAEVTAPGGTTITAGGTVTVGNGTANIALPGGTAVSVPTGSTIRPDGTVSIGAGGATVQIAIRTSATGNNAGAAVQNPDGSVGIGDVSLPLAAVPGTSPSLTLKLAANTVIVLDEAAPLGYSVEFNNPYSDVQSSDWFYGDAAFVSAHSLMTGTAADKFSPNAQATRGMIVTVLFRLAAPAKGANTTDFTDVPLGKYYSDAVAWAAENEIVSGIGGGRFAPDANITRQDLAVILTRYAEYKGFTLAAAREYAAFSDDNAVSDYARAAVETCYRVGIISGKPASSIVSGSEHQLSPQGGNLFDPKGEATRAEVAAMLHRFVLAMAGEDVPLSAAPVSADATVPNPKTGQPFSSSDAAAVALIGATASGSLFAARRKDDAEPDEDEA